MRTKRLYVIYHTLKISSITFGCIIKIEKQEKIRLGIDEHSISGRKKMALLIVELISSTPVAVFFIPTKKKSFYIS